MLKISIVTLNFPSFSASKFAFFDEKFMTRRFSDSPKFSGGGLPPATTPLIALQYDLHGLRRPWTLELLRTWRIWRC